MATRKKDYNPCRRVTTQSGDGCTGGCAANRAKRPHSNTPCVRKSPAGPAARPHTPLAVENSVGEVTAESKDRAPKVHPMGKRVWRTPTPALRARCRKASRSRLFKGDAQIRHCCAGHKPGSGAPGRRAVALKTDGTLPESYCSMPETYCTVAGTYCAVAGTYCAVPESNCTVDKSECTETKTECGVSKSDGAVVGSNCTAGGSYCTVI